MPAIPKSPDRPGKEHTGAGTELSSQLLKNHFPGSAPEEFGFSFPDVRPVWSGLLPVEHSESAA